MVQANIPVNVKYDGTTVQLQNMTLVLPPLNFGAFRKHGALKKLQLVIDGMAALETGKTVDLPDEVLDAAVELVWLSARRNYPEITKEEIEEGLDFENIGKIIPILISKNSVEAIQEAKNV